MAAPPLSPGAHSCIMRSGLQNCKYHVFAIGMFVGGKPPRAHSCWSMFCLCFAVSAFLSGNRKSHQITIPPICQRRDGHAAKCSATAQIAILRFCKTPLFVGGLAGGEVSSAVRCPRILSQICKPQICKTNWFGKFLPMHVCNFLINHCNQLIDQTIN